MDITKEIKEWFNTYDEFKYEDSYDGEKDEWLIEKAAKILAELVDREKRD